jgi:hypothetical protein
MSKGRKVPESPIDHAANLRDRLGKAAYDAFPDDEAPPWEQLRESGRDMYRRVGQAVMDVIVPRDDRRGDFSVSSIYGYKSQKPYVNVEVSISPMQLSPAKAREIALMLLESADASESDAALIGFARDALGMSETDQAKLINQFRQYRETARPQAANSA